MRYFLKQKKIDNMKPLFTLFISFVFFMSQFSSDLNAQCTGDITLTTQSEVNAFSCSNWMGNLIIQDDPMNGDNITDLTPIFNNVAGGLVTVSGDFELIDCDFLLSLNGLQGLTDVGGNFEISFSSILVNIDFFPLLQSVGGDFRVVQNSLLVDINTFDNLSSVGNKFAITGNSILNIPDFSLITSITGQITLSGAFTTLDIFSNLTSANFILGIGDSDNLQTISGFDNLVNVGSLLISDNPQLTTIDAFNTLTSAGKIKYTDNPSLVSSPAYDNLTTLDVFEYDNSGEITSDFATITTIESIFIRYSTFTSTINLFPNLQDVTSYIAFAYNPDLVDLNGFGSVTSIELLELVSNPDLNCCDVIPLAAVSNNVNISNNGVGCFFFNDFLNNPPIVNCPADESVELIGGQTTISVSIAVPTVTYSCDLDEYVMNVVDQNSNPIITNQIVTEGSTESVSLPEGDNVISFSATGNNNLTGMCSYTITVDPPSCFGTITLTTQADVDAFDCATFDGDLIIEDDGSDPITTFTNSLLSGLTTVTGSLTIINNPDLTSLDGLENLIEVSGSLTIENCLMLSDLSALDNLVTIGNVLQIHFTGATDLTFNSLVDPFKIDIRFNNSLLDISGFNSVVDMFSLEIWNASSIQDISGFQSLLTLDEDLQLTNLFNIPGVTGFGSITNVGGILQINAGPFNNGFPDFGNSYTVGTVNIISCNMIEDISNLSSIISIGLDLNILNNGILSDCCIIPDITVGGIYNISNNDLGCNSFAEIGSEAPAWDDLTLSLSLTGVCGVDNSATLANANIPTAMDDCDITTVTQVSMVPVTSCGASEVMIFSYEATDDDGNINPDLFEITVTLEDLTAPVLSTVPADVTIFCNDPIPTPPALTAMDVCKGDVSADIVITPSSVTGACTTGTLQEEITYTYTVDDGCGNIGTAMWKTTIMNDFVVDLGPDISACNINVTLDAGAGNTYLWTTGETTQTIIVSSLGTYGVEVTSNNGCCSSDEIVVNVGTSPDISVTDGTLNCTDNSIQLFATTTSTGATFGWIGPNGFTSTVQDPIVSDPGLYNLTVTSVNGCTSGAVSTVIEDIAAPGAVATGGTLTCTDTQINITGSTTNGVSYLWIGPNGFSSTLASPIVIEPGSYDLTVTGANGCISLDNAQVLEDIEEPDVLIMGGTINCADSEVELLSSVVATNPVYAWTGPNGFSSTDESPLVTDIGTYTLVVTGDNGCFSTAQTEVDQDFVQPDLFVVGANLDCFTPIAAITAFSTDANATFQWTGPDFFVSTAASPLVSDPGNYFVTVTSSNGCSNSDQVTVTTTSSVPDLEVNGGTVDCNNTSVTLTSSTDQDVATYQWTGPNGFVAGIENPTVTQQGTYNLMITTVDGCTADLDAIVVDDTAIPDVNLVGSLLTCSNNVVEIMSTTTSMNATFTWTGPNGFTSSDQNPMVSESGTYNLLITGTNGCSKTESIVIEDDITEPTASADAGTLSCNMSNVQIATNLSNDVASYSWSGPNGFTSNDEDPLVNTAGIYTLNMLGNNGCSNTLMISVEADFDAPDASATGGVIGCGPQSVVLMANSETEDVTYGWAGPGGFASSDQSPTAGIVGFYTLTVTGPNGCIAFAVAEISENTESPDLAVSGGTIDCNSDEVVLSANSTVNDVSYSWTGPNGFTSNEQNPTVTIEGEYEVTVLGSNGCSNTKNALVVMDIETPDAMANGGTIDCINTEITLIGSSSDMNVTYSWTGPGGFASTDQNPTTSEPGEYILTVMSSNGCSVTTIAEVVDDAKQPEVTLSLGDANCEDGTRILLAEVDEMDLNVIWTGPNGFASNELSTSITTAGTYTLQTFPSNGCNSTHSITMDENVGLSADIETQDIVGGNEFGSATIIITSGTGEFIIEWDNGETGETAVSLEEGVHTVSVTDGLGCTLVFEFTIDIINSIEESELSVSMSIYPNPASEVLNIEFSNSEEKITDIEIINVNGQIVKQIEIKDSRTSILVSVDEWSSGVYFVKVNADHLFKMEKFFIR